MKLYYLIILFALGVVISSCEPDYAVEDYFDLQELPGYVAFNADGNNATMDDVATDENAGSVRLVIENPTGTLSDITVNYSLGGSAVYGTDYSISGGSASGGSVTIKPNSGAINETNRTSLTVTILPDSIADGEKNITITLTDAKNTEGNVAVGRGGTDFLKSATVIIADVD